MPETTHQVIIHHPRRLHMRVDDRRTDKIKPALFEVLAYHVRLFARCRNLRSLLPLVHDGLSIDENGVDVGAAEVMTGVRHMGFAKPYDDMALGTCGDWKLDSGDNLLVGSTAGGPIVWSYDTARDCKTKARIYCLMLNSTETVEAPKDTGKVIYLSSTYFKPGQGAPDAVCAATKPAGVAGSVKALLSTPTDAATSTL